MMWKWKWAIAALISLLLCITQAEAPSSAQVTVCTHFVDNQASYDGDGSQAQPWDSIADHVDDLSPGDVMCVRGSTSTPGRVYRVGEEIRLTKSGTASDPITLRPYPNENVVIQNSGESALLLFNDVEYWVIEGLTFDHNGRWTWAIIFQEGSSYNVLRHNEIYGGRLTGIVVKKGAADNTVEGNHIHDFSNPDSDAACILIQVEAHNTLVRQNTIHDCSGDGVQLLEDSSDPSAYAEDVEILDNVFYRGTVTRAENAIDIKAAKDLVVSRNTMYGYVDYAAVLLQKASQNVLFELNIIHDSARGFNIHAEDGGHPEGLTLENNLLYDLSEYGIQVTGVKSCTIVHNTIINAQQYSLRVVLSGWDGGLMQNNLFVNSGEAQLKRDVTFSDVTVGYNGWFDTDADDVFTHRTDTVGSGDPGFVDDAEDDYHLTAESLVRDAGTDTGVATDFEGDPRPWGAWPDIGADEYVPILYLAAVPCDQAVILRWTEYEDPDLVSYVITYTYAVGGSPAAEGPSPISGIPSSTHQYTLTELSNYVFYTATVAARDGSQADLAVSNSVRRMPTDIFSYLPAILKTRFVE